MRNRECTHTGPRTRRGGWSRGIRLGRRQAGAADDGATKRITPEGRRDATAVSGLAAEVVMREEEVGCRES